MLMVSVEVPVVNMLPETGFVPKFAVALAGKVELVIVRVAF